MGGCALRGAGAPPRLEGYRSVIADSLLDCLGTEAKKNCISSTTDAALGARPSFAPKSVLLLGPPWDPDDSGAGYACLKGSKGCCPNQDCWLIAEVERCFSIYAVFDGHGRCGHDTANFVKEHLPKLVVLHPRFGTSEMAEVFRDAFVQMQGMISKAVREKELPGPGGTTATLVIHDHVWGKVHAAYVGDSSACLCASDGRVSLITEDHKPNVRTERRRIERRGGRVVFDGLSHRVYCKKNRSPGLNMSRSLGDLEAHRKAGLTCIPDVSTCCLRPEDDLLLLCSDGVWEFLSPQQAFTIVREHTSEGATAAATALAWRARDTWVEKAELIVDDITVVVVLLKHQALQGFLDKEAERGKIDLGLETGGPEEKSEQAGGGNGRENGRAAA